MTTSVEYLPDRVHIMLTAAWADEHKLGHAVAIKGDLLHYILYARGRPEMRAMPWPADIDTTHLPPEVLVTAVKTVIMLDVIRGLAEAAAQPITSTARRRLPATTRSYSFHLGER